MKSIYRNLAIKKCIITQRMNRGEFRNVADAVLLKRTSSIAIGSPDGGLATKIDIFAGNNFQRIKNKQPENYYTQISSVYAKKLSKTIPGINASDIFNL